ncbi:MAG: hypothetical protein ACQESE_03330 [Nanobdellota archaeon]
MTVDNIVENSKIPKELKKFSFWNSNYQGATAYQNGSCSSFCTGGACTIGLKDKGYFKEKRNYNQQ